MNIEHISKEKNRILVVDDDPRAQKDLFNFLKDAGYDVKVPMAQGRELFNKAKEDAKLFRPHIAIVDISLDGNVTDRSGIELLEELRSARCILYSGNLSWDITRDLQRKYPKTTWVDKDEYFKNLLDVIQEKTTDVSASASKLIIHKAKGWSETVIRALLGKDTTAPKTLVDDILTQLFPSSTQIVLEALDQSIVTPQSVSRGRSAVVKVFHDGKFEPYIVKIAPSDAIKREVDNYKKYIEGNLVGRFMASLQGDTIFWDLGGVLYSFLDHSEQKLVSFREHYDRHSDVLSIISPLRHFYKSTWGKLYEQSEANKKEVSLGEYYDRVFRLGDRIREFPNKDDKIYIPGISSSLPNPVQWLNKHMQDSTGIIYRTAITHGDLHSDNLFVDSNYAWVIDFERSGFGHILRDFIELEVDIITRLGPGINGNDLNSELLLAGLIITSKFDSIQEVDACNCLTNPELKKALAVIEEHRKICAEIVYFSDFREYLWALLFDLVFLATLIEQNKLQRDRALLLGGIVCERLKSGNKVDWPPENLLKLALMHIRTPLASEDQNAGVPQNLPASSTMTDVAAEVTTPKMTHTVSAFTITAAIIVATLWGINKINPSPWVLGITALILIPIAIVFALVISGHVKGLEGVKTIRDIALGGIRRFLAVSKDKENSNDRS